MKICGFEEKDVFVCESRYQETAQAFHPIKMWKMHVPRILVEKGEICPPLKLYSKPITIQKTVPSVFLNEIKKKRGKQSKEEEQEEQEEQEGHEEEAEEEEEEKELEEQTEVQKEAQKEEERKEKKKEEKEDTEDKIVVENQSDSSYSEDEGEGR